MLYETKSVKTKDTSLQDKTNRKNLVADLTGHPEEEECTFKPKINEKTKKLVKRSNTDQPVNEILYKSALDKKAKEKEVEAEARQNASKIANSNKISVNSMKIVFKRIETALRSLIQDVESSENLSFEGLGVLLHRLGVFKSSEFNQTEEILNRSTLSINQAKIKQQTLAKEVAFHENLWKILANASPNENVVQGEIVFRFLMVLLEDKASVAEAALFLQDIMNIGLEERGFKNDKKGTSLFEKIRKEYDLWDMEKLVTEFRKLFNDKTIFMNIYSNAGVLPNKSIVDENETFRPQINPKSKNLDNAGENYRNKVKSISQVPGSTSKLQTRFDMLFEYHKYVKEKHNENMETKIEQELANCTFKPQITEYKKKDRDGNLSNITYTSQEISKAKRHDLLYDVARVQKEKMTQKAYEIKKQEEVKQLSECTFQPRINTNSDEYSYSVRESVTTAAPPKGYSKAVQRMKAAEKQREEKRAEREHVPRGENYEKLKNSDFKPPSFLSRPKNQKNEALVYVDVNIGPGKTGRIGIHRGDDARTLAKNFARTYSLPPVMKESLEKLLQTYIDSYFPEYEEGEEREEGEEEEEEEDGEEYEQERYERVGEIYQHREPVKEHDEEDEEDEDEDEDEEEEEDDDLDLDNKYGEDDDSEEDDDDDEEDEAPVRNVRNQKRY